LARIRQQVKEGALQRLSARPGKKRDVVDTTAYDAIKSLSLKRPFSRGGYITCVIIYGDRCHWDKFIEGFESSGCWGAVFSIRRHSSSG